MSSRRAVVIGQRSEGGRRRKGVSMQTLAQRIRAKEFARSRKGFDAGEVESFLEMLADEVEALESELRKESVRANALERRVLTPEQAEGNLEAAFLAAAETKQKLMKTAQTKLKGADVKK